MRDVPTPGLAFPAALVVTGLAAVFVAWDWPTSARIFPTIFGALLALLSLAELLRSWRRHAQNEETPEGANFTASTLLWILALPLLGQLFGYLIAVPVTTFFFARILGGAGVRASLLSGAVVLTVVLFMTKMLHLPLPTGAFW